MADWYVKMIDRSQGAQVGEYSVNPTCEIRNSEPGGFGCELALGQLKRGSTVLGIGRDEFAPYKTNYELWRQSTGNGVCISDGMLTSINLNKDRDTVLVSGKDMIHYLQRRIYPFTPEDYITLDPAKPERFFDKWPKKWPTMAVGDQDPIDIALIVRDIIQSMNKDYPVDALTTTVPSGYAPGVPHITQSVPLTEQTGKYKIYPGDSTTIFDHLTKLSEMTDKGFEFDILPISLEFKLWTPRRTLANEPPFYGFSPSDNEEGGAITQWDWTNDGPEGTYLLGLGTRDHRVGATWTDEDNVAEFGRLDKVYDFGAISIQDMLLQMLKDQNDLHPQKKLNLQLLNPEFLTPNFYTGGRPRNLIGTMIHAGHDFAPLHNVDAFFRINAISWDVDKSTNEYVDLELEMNYDP
jgi:hypothetical protein